MAGARNARGDVGAGSSSTSSAAGSSNLRSNSGGFLSPKATGGGVLGRPASSSHQPAGIAEMAAAAREQMQQFFGR